ncbi:LytR/AlgR family response regulator transcription factor [Aquimarina muelleri]|uniref:LytR/AlgR family response regulator transcription factor n=1 Tax=Aquimarina muelleri TaxID=279356 RepID=UPI003F685DAD
MKIKCLLIDDDRLSTQILKKHLDHFDDFEIISICNNAVDAFNFICKNTIDLVFVDICMPIVNGLEFIQGLQTSPPIIIITSSSKDYAVEGFELGVLDYLVKPVCIKRLVKSLHKVSRAFNISKNTMNISENQIEQDDHIFIKVNKKMIKIYYDDILYIESLKDYVIVKTKYGDYVTHYNLAAITKLLPSYLFIRIHRSYTIAIHKVEAINKNNIEINDNLIPMGRNYIKEAKDIIINGVTSIF